MPGDAADVDEYSIEINGLFNQGRGRAVRFVSGKYRKVSNIRRIKSQNLNFSRLIL